MSDHANVFGALIHTYSRAQAVADGELVDVSPTAREAGITFPVAVTRAVWEDCVAWTEDDNGRKGALQDESGRLWDVCVDDPVRDPACHPGHVAGTGTALPRTA